MPIPALLIVGGDDPTVHELDEQADRETQAAGTQVDLLVEPGATHLLEEAGAPDTVAAATVEQLCRWPEAGR